MNKPNIYQIKGMHCASCANIIERTFKKSEGVEFVEVNYGTETTKIVFDKSKTNLGNIENVIVMAGYQANDKPANAEAYEKLDDCCKIGGHDE